MFAKTEVNGADANPIFTFLKSRCPSPDLKFKKINRLFYEPLHADDIRWNFEKFLIDPMGKPLARYPETVNPLDIIPHIDYLLDSYFRGSVRY